MDTKTLMTADEFEAVAERLGPCELVRGEVIELSPGGFSHSHTTMNVAGLLWEWARRTHLGRTVTGEMGVVVGKDPDTVRGADVAYYSYARIPDGTEPEGFSAVPPNLVVEVVGKGQGWREMVEKVGEYLGMGVDRVWVLDPQPRRVHVFRTDGEPVILDANDALVDEVILPGFLCRVGDLFAK